MMTEKFKIGNLEVDNGEKLQGYLEVVNTQIRMPTTLINGNKPGMTIAITGGIHGGEYPGIEASIRLAKELKPDEISGRIIIVHPVNIPAFEAKFQYYNPYDGKNLNREFPGRAMGTISERIAYTITTELHDKADFYIDLHGGDLHEELIPFIVYPQDADEEIVKASKEAASLMGIKYIIGSSSTSGTYGSAAKRGTPGFLAELGSRGLWSEDEVKQYMTGVKNVLKHFNILSGESQELGDSEYLKEIHEVPALQKGCWYPTVKPGDKVMKDQNIGEIRDYFGNTLKEYYSPTEGMILLVARSLAITEGEPLISMA